jgi:hypothetical protein
MYNPGRDSKPGAANEAAEREERDVRAQHGEIHQDAHVADRGAAERQQDEESDRERHPAEVAQLLATSTRCVKPFMVRLVFVTSLS